MTSVPETPEIHCVTARASLQIRGEWSLTERVHLREIWRWRMYAEPTFLRTNPLVETGRVLVIPVFWSDTRFSKRLDGGRRVSVVKPAETEL